MNLDDPYRPYPVPSSPFVMHQSWHDLLFIHYRVPAELLRAVVPPSLPLDTFQGEAYVGVVPFRMARVRPRFIPPLPWLSFFPELNVRTYVTLDGRPGVYFFSPYFKATMQCRAVGGEIRYRSARTDRRGKPAVLQAQYAPTGPAFIAERDSLEYFLTARYCLYTLNARQEVLRAEIHHEPWALQAARLQAQANTMLDPLGLSLPPEEPHLLFVKKLHVFVWPPKRLNPAPSDPAAAGGDNGRPGQPGC
jgi:uncharacterized protein